MADQDVVQSSPAQPQPSIPMRFTDNPRNERLRSNRPPLVSPPTMDAILACPIPVIIPQPSHLRPSRLTPPAAGVPELVRNVVVNRFATEGSKLLDVIRKGNFSSR